MYVLKCNWVSMAQTHYLLQLQRTRLELEEAREVTQRR